MEAYEKLVRELIEDHIEDVQGWDKTKTRKDILRELLAPQVIYKMLQEATK